MDPFPIWMQDVPEVGIPFTEVEGRLIASPHGRVVFFRASRRSRCRRTPTAGSGA